MGPVDVLFSLKSLSTVYTKKKYDYLIKTSKKSKKITLKIPN